jgi:hypothetical protein
MAFVPEGQADSSQARSAWSHEKNIPVPAGRLNGKSQKSTQDPRLMLTPMGDRRTLRG